MNPNFQFVTEKVSYKFSRKVLVRGSCKVKYKLEIADISSLFMTTLTWIEIGDIFLSFLVV